MFFAQISHRSSIEAIMMDICISDCFCQHDMRRVFEKTGEDSIQTFTYLKLGSGNLGWGYNNDPSIRGPSPTANALQHMGATLQAVRIPILHIDAGLYGYEDLMSVLEGCNGVERIDLNCKDIHHYNGISQFMVGSHCSLTELRIYPALYPVWQDSSVSDIGRIGYELLLTALARNETIQRIRLPSCEGFEVERFHKLLCNCNSFDELMYNSNHIIGTIDYDYLSHDGTTRHLDDFTVEMLGINSLENKGEVRRRKVMIKLHSTDPIDIGGLIGEMHPCLVVRLIATDLDSNRKPTALYNVFRAMPSLCQHAKTTHDANNNISKRMKVEHRGLSAECI
jgi:hypothetical protein